MRGAHEHEHHRKQSNCYENMNNNGAKRKNKDCRILVISGAGPLLRLASLWALDPKHSAQVSQLQTELSQLKNRVAGASLCLHAAVSHAVCA